MSFWTSNPVKLFEDINVIPNENQPYDQRMNTLTRLILLIAIVLYLFKVNGSLQFLIIGIVIIIILYYSQRNDMSKPTVQGLRESFIPQEVLTQNIPGAQTEYTPLGPIIFSTKHGPGSKEYRRIPIEPPRPAMASDWGGYYPRIDRVQDMVIPSGYSSEIAWGHQSPSGVSSGVTMLPRLPGSREDPRGVESFNGYPRAPSVPAPPSSASNEGQFGSIGIVGEGTSKVYQETPLPFTLDVEGPDHRFAAGNDYFIHRRVASSPTHVPYYPQPLNRGGGLESSPEVRDTSNHVRYETNLTPPWSPEYIHNARTQYQRGVFPDDRDDRTGQYRSASTLGNPSQYNPRYDSGGGDGYRNIGDLPGNNQYYVANPDPFAGMFAINSEASHMDLLTGNGTVIPQYRRDGVEIDDYITVIGDRQTADELYHRDSMVEAAAAKIAETEYQYRMGPVRRGMRH